mgnify:CR=1 FL=1
MGSEMCIRDRDKNNVVPTNTELRGTPENILVLGKAPLTPDTTIVH